MTDNSVINAAISYIEDNLQENLSLDDIEKKLNYSKFYINRLFVKKVGCTMHKYIQVRRLTEAARHLAETDKPIIEIAFEAHYNSQQAFTAAFQQIYLCTPKAYRKNGIFYPMQTRITMQTRISCYQNLISMSGGNIAA